MTIHPNPIALEPGGDFARARFGRSVKGAKVRECLCRRARLAFEATRSLADSLIQRPLKMHVRCSPCVLGPDISSPMIAAVGTGSTNEDVGQGVFVFDGQGRDRAAA